MIFKVMGIVSALAMIGMTSIIIGAKFGEYGLGLPFFFVSSIATFSLLVFGSIVVSLCFHLDSEIAETTGCRRRRRNMETEIVKTMTRIGSVEFHQEELREVPKTVLRKVNRDGTKIWETPIGKTLKIIKKYTKRVKK